MKSRKPEELYLDLMKKTLSFALWPEPPIPIDMFEYKRFRPATRLLSWISHLLELGHLQLVKQRPVSLHDREEGGVLPGYADTMIGLKRLENLQSCIETVLKERIPGDLIESGVWRGGACIFMRAVLAAYGISDRKVYVADSFEGLPKPDAETFPADRGDKHYRKRFLAISQAEVAANFENTVFSTIRSCFSKDGSRTRFPMLGWRSSLCFDWTVICTVPRRTR
jgi:hypothetical protein